jgi:hypothetical protein
VEELRIKELRDKAGFSCGVLPVNGYVAIKVTKRQEDIMEGRIPTEGIYKGASLEKEKMKEESFEVVAVPTEFVVHADKATCQVGDRVVLSGAKIDVLDMGKGIKLVSSRSIIAVVI